MGEVYVELCVGTRTENIIAMLLPKRMLPAVGDTRCITVYAELNSDR